MLAMGACKKGDPRPPEGDYYVKFKLDGAQRDFRTTVVAYKHEQRIETTTVYSISIAGVGAPGNVTSSLTVAATAFNTPISEKTYRGDAIGVIYLPRYDREDSFGADGHHDDFTLSIDEMTGDYVKGKFSGKISPSDGNGSTQLSITDGEFYAPIISGD